MKKTEKSNKEKLDKKVLKKEKNVEKVKTKKKIDKMKLATQIFAVIMVFLMLVGFAGSFIYYIIRMF